MQIQNVSLSIHCKGLQLTHALPPVLNLITELDASDLQQVIVDNQFATSNVSCFEATGAYLFLIYKDGGLIF